MHNLEEQFALLVAGMELPKKQMPDLTWAPRQTFAARSKTVYMGLAARNPIVISEVSLTCISISDDDAKNSHAQRLFYVLRKRQDRVSLANHFGVVYICTLSHKQGDAQQARV